MGKLFPFTTPTTTLTVLGPDGFAAGEKGKGDKGEKGRKVRFRGIKATYGKKRCGKLFFAQLLLRKRDMNISN